MLQSDIRKMENRIWIKRVIRSRRRSFALQVTEKAELIVRAPLRASEAMVAAIVGKHTGWIARKRAEALEKASQRVEKKFVQGEEFLFLGRSWPLVLVENQAEDLVFADGFFLKASASRIAEEAFRTFYTRQLINIAADRAAMFSARQGINFHAIRISNARKRWGSCSPDGRISFSWRLAMAPVPVIDYVVAHELAHVRRHDHSAAFWKLVEQMVPEFRERKKWLRERAHLLTIA
jgi:hypothetical protein